MIFKVGMGSCGISAGAENVYKKLLELSSKDRNISVQITGCLGFCYAEPLIEFIDSDVSFFLKNVTEQAIEKIFNEIVVNKNYNLPDYIFQIDRNSELFRNRIVLRNCGVINPEDINDYINREGYEAIKYILSNKIQQDEIINVIKMSGLRGRGGAGFPTGLKWEIVKNSKSTATENQKIKKYIVCNADEGDPGAFMDRSVLESDPHSVIEGMLICGYAVGAQKGIIYVRTEYPLAIKRLKIAIEQAYKNNLLGSNICDSDFYFDISIKEGAGAFVCGEETALLQSIEGKRGMPRYRPPYPAEKGLFNLPTNINNVETYANIPWIILNGATKFYKIGTEKSKGTKVFALTGKIQNTGLIEVPMGITLEKIIFDIGAGIKDNKKIKAVQIGGPSGGCIPAHLLNTIIDYESLKELGAIMGSGGLVVMDEETCMVDVARFFLNFTKDESCGKCTYCRIGTKRLLEILNKITEGKGELSDIEKLVELAEKIKISSLCGLGQSAPNPVLTTVKYFKNEYI